MYEKHIEMVQVGKRWYRGGEICDVGAELGECGVVVQVWDWFSWIVGG